MESDQGRTDEGRLMARATTPIGGFVVYAFVAISIFSIGLFFFARFYSLEISEYPVFALVGGAAIVCFSGFLRWHRVRRYRLQQTD
jgi:hypothetical protein